MSDNIPQGEIPINVDKKGCIYATAYVNGSDSLRFLVDTGATTIVLNSNSSKLKGKIFKGVACENEGTTGQNSVEISNDNSLTIGDIEYEKAECVHIPYNPNYLDGVFALNGLSAFNVEINYDDNKIYCYSKEDSILVDSSSVAEFPFTYQCRVQQQVQN